MIKSNESTSPFISPLYFLGLFLGSLVTNSVCRLYETIGDMAWSMTAVNATCGSTRGVSSLVRFCVLDDIGLPKSWADESDAVVACVVA